MIEFEIIDCDFIEYQLHKPDYRDWGKLTNCITIPNDKIDNLKSILKKIIQQRFCGLIWKMT
jgi:hypothetical protein